MGENTPHIDNRYSPIYQRGGSPQPQSNGLNPQSHASPSPNGTRLQPAPPPPPPSAYQPVDTDPASIVEVLPEGASSPPPAVPKTRRSAIRRINPFLAVLWIIGLGALALGLWAFFAPLQVDESVLTGPYPQWIYIASQSAGGILMGGCIILAVAGGLSALLWDRRPR